MAHKSFITCQFCSGEGFHKDDCFRRFTKGITRREIGHLAFNMELECENYPGETMVDTRIKLDFPEFFIAWKNSNQLADELAAVIRKYQI